MNFVVSETGMMVILIVIPIAITFLLGFIFFKVFKSLKERNLLLKEITNKLNK